MGASVAPVQSQPKPIEMHLMEQANEAVKQGADPHAATEMLGTMIKHLRANPQVGAQANAALAQGADPHDVSSKVWELANTPAEPGPGVLSRAGSMIRGAASQAIHHPIETAASLVTAPIKSAFTAAVAPSVGENRPDPRLSKGGNASGRAIDTTPYDAEHGGVTPSERTAAGVQSVVNAALPAVIPKVGGALIKAGANRVAANAAGAGVGGMASGAAYDPTDPLAGAIAGGTIGSTLGAVAPAVGSVAKAGASKVGNVLSRVASMDDATAPGLSGIGPRAAAVAGAGDTRVSAPLQASNRATSLLLTRLERAGLTPQEALDRLAQVPADKPITVMELAGDQSHPVRQLGKLVARTPSKGAADLRASIAERAAPLPNAQRVLGDVGEAMGVDRTNLVEHSQKLSGQRLAAAKPSYDAAFGEDQPPVPLSLKASGEDGPALQDLLNRPSVKAAIAFHNDVAAERGEPTLSLSPGQSKPTAVPPGFSPEQWASVQKDLAAKQHTIRDPSGKLRADLSQVPDEHLDAEWQRLAELNAREESLHGGVRDAGYREDYEALPRTEKLGHKGKEDLPDADGNIDPEKLAADNKIVADYNKSIIVRRARSQAMQRIQAEINRRPESFSGDDSFEFGANAPAGGESTGASAAGGGIPLKTLQQIKFKLDDMLGFAKERGQLPDGTPATKAKLGAINDTRLALLDIMGQHSPEYAKGNEVWAGESALQNAGKTGREFLSAPIDEVQTSVKSMTPGEKEQHNISALSGPIRDRLFKTSAVDRAKILSQPDITERLQSVVPADQMATLLRNAGHEHQMALTNQQVVGGSDTAENLQNQFDAGGPAAKAIATAAMHGPQRAAAQLFKNMLESKIAARLQGVNEKTSNDLAPMLTAGIKSRADATAFLQELDRQFQLAAKRRSTLPKSGAVAGTATGALTARQR